MAVTAAAAASWCASRGDDPSVAASALLMAVARQMAVADCRGSAVARGGGAGAPG